jgi:murein DD-endopeptidase MepM/ murein hydrolase activator NlpD
MEKTSWFHPMPEPYQTCTQCFCNPNPELYRKTGIHPGSDWGTRGASNIELRAVADSEIVYSQSESTPMGKWLGNHCALFVPSENKSFLYCHSSASFPEVGTKVTAGQKIGVCGKTGFSRGIHLHLEGYTGKFKIAMRSFKTKEDIIRICFDTDAFIKEKLSQ